MLLKDSNNTLSKKGLSPKALNTIYGSNGTRFIRNQRLNPLLPQNSASPKNRSNDLYTFQKSLFRSKPVKNNPEAFRKTFSMQKNDSTRISRLSSSDSKRVVKVMMNTTLNFRPPTTAMRRCADEEESNYLSRYEIIKQLGKGTYGLVHLARKKQKGSLTDSLLVPLAKSQAPDMTEKGSEGVVQQSETLYAIKVYQKFKMNKDPTKFKNIRKQINIMQNIEHQHIIKLCESVDTPTKISLVVEYGGDQSLLEYLKQNFPLSEPTMKRICQQLLCAISYLHEKNIVHRDIKLQNVLMLNGEVKLIDFGFGTLTYKNRKLNAICGTPNYMAPEVLSKKQYIGEQADIWSFGVVAFTLGQGKHPFKAETYNELQRLVNKGNVQFKRITNPIYQAFIKRILKIKPNQRPTALQMLNHPWITLSE